MPGGGCGEAGRTAGGERGMLCSHDCRPCPSGCHLGLMAPLPGRLFGLLYWWVGTTWYRLTTAASLLDVFVLTR